MEKPFLYIVMILCCLSSRFRNPVLHVNAIESPQFTMVYSESEFEIRFYEDSWWMSALVEGTSFQKSTKDGFHRLYQYIHGENLNSSKLALAAPVLTSINKSSHGFVYLVRLYLSPKCVGSPPQPNPELNLQLDKRESQCVAVRKVSGYAEDDNVNQEADALVASLKENNTGRTIVFEDTDSYSIAQYNSSHHPSGRLNEVWMDISGLNAEKCSPHQVLSWP